MSEKEKPRLEIKRDENDVIVGYSLINSSLPIDIMSYIGTNTTITQIIQDIQNAEQSVKKTKQDIVDLENFTVVKK